MLKYLLYNKGINCFLRNALKPFSTILPLTFKFPINGTFLVNGNHVPPFKIKTNPTSYASKVLFWNNVEGFEFSSVKIFCEMVKSSKVFFDIGANIGYYSLLASAIKEKEIIVYAFEPMPSAYDFLKQNCLINNFDNIKPYNIALSDKKGSATFYAIANEKFKNMPQLTGDGGLSEQQSGNRTKINFEVTINSLDNFVLEHLVSTKIDLIKLDTEANEHLVLAGAKMVLAEHRPIIQCEILKQQKEMEIEEVLSGYNYLYYRATDLGLVQVQSFLDNPTDYVDYYLVPEEKLPVIQTYIHK